MLQRRRVDAQRLCQCAPTAAYCIIQVRVHQLAWEREGEGGWLLATLARDPLSAISIPHVPSRDDSLFPLSGT